MKIAAFLIIACLIFLPSCCGRAVEPKPFSRFELNEGKGTIAYDSIFDTSGTLKGDTTWVSFPRGGHALYFNDQRYDYVEGTNSPFDFADTAFTVSAWFKTSDSVFILSEGGYLNGGWGIDCQGPNIHIQLKERAYTAYDAYYARSTGRAYNDGTWHHIAAVITTNTTNAKGNYSKLYMDGSPAALDEHQVYPYWPSGDNWKIGSLQLTNGNLGSLLKYRGTVADVRVYDRPLIDKEIGRIYRRGLGKYLLFKIRK